MNAGHSERAKNPEGTALSTQEMGDRSTRPHRGTS